MSESIKIENVCKSYKSKKALNNVSFSIDDGELFGLLGVNGAGKTTLIKILCGLTQKDGGKAYIKGFDVDEDMEKIKRIVDVSPQETAVAPNLTVKENLDFFSEIYGSEDDGRINEIISAFHLDEVAEKRAKTLSGGWMRRLSIALALVSNPQIVFLDEPTLGLDVIARRELWKIIKSLKGKVTVVLTSHYLEEIEALCDRVGILANGNLLEVGTVEEIKSKTGKSSFEDAFIQIVDGEI